ncbi:glycosyltransferase family 2 protein [Wenjunlia tyrosinilytica]|uniref:Glycosyl transferase n=1 Tax=Wenjunlia tyrosinilytica TaxID=1544741 RepID=A0A917ZUK4_9ACTN|nr:glycosyltransferase family A protein [Wenjunlia tyrosinilytica]GGO96147.1 glycosyl transferase [Wenjunlia tyrosinilytica]
MSSVTVVVPAYNYARYLPGCVEAALAEEGLDVRVLVIDDCSSDDTPEVTAELARDPRVSCLRHEANQGHVVTINEGLAAVTTDYTALVSADDLLTPGALGRAVRVLEENSGVGFVYGRALRFVSGRPLPSARADGSRAVVVPGGQWVERVCRAARSPILSPEVVMRTSLSHEAGGYDPRLPHAGDLAMWLRLASRADVAWLPRADQAFYRVHDSNMHHSVFDGRRRLDQLIAAYDVFLEKEGPRLGGRESARLDGLAKRAVARWCVRKAVTALDEGRREVDGMTVEELHEVAAGLTDLRRLPEYPALRLRLRLGARRCGRLRPLTSLLTLSYPRAWVRWHSRRLRPV